MAAEGEKAGALCTIGYERASLAGFVAALKEARVETLIDVRDQPWSQRPEFRRDALRRHLLDARIGYVHIRALGNPKEGREAAKAGDLESYRRRMDERLASADGQKGLAKAAELARRGPVCLMCYERDPAHCHRARVADDLTALGLGPPRHLFAS
ncbi:MAG: DUF488 domain-containing protein [Rhodospirillales bacterium]|nr:DUF488 domain-containing protein [Rhodospirillales bacterium]